MMSRWWLSIAAWERFAIAISNCEELVWPWGIDSVKPSVLIADEAGGSNGGGNTLGSTNVAKFLFCPLSWLWLRTPMFGARNVLGALRVGEWKFGSVGECEREWRRVVVCCWWWWVEGDGTVSDDGEATV